MNCEVCFKPCDGRRCAKHPEIPKDLLYKEIRDNPAIGMECRMQELEAQQEPCHYQDTSEEATVDEMIWRQHESWLKKQEIYATPTQFQQIKGELNHLQNRINEHLDKSKRPRSKYA